MITRNAAVGPRVRASETQYSYRNCANYHFQSELGIVCKINTHRQFRIPFYITPWSDQVILITLV